MTTDLHRIENELTPLLEVHGVELVALDWLQGPGHGLLRVYIDRPGGDPRKPDPELSVSVDQVTHATRDISNALDELDLIEGAYTLEVSSPGTERPVQKRADFDRFVGLGARLDVREGIRKRAIHAVLRGTTDAPEEQGGFVVHFEVGGKPFTMPAVQVLRTRLHEIEAPPKLKPGKGALRRQERLAQREKARAVNAAHLATKQGQPAGAPAASNDSTAPTEQNSPAAVSHGAKR